MARKEDEKLTLVSSEFVKSIAEEAEIQIDNEKILQQLAEDVTFQLRQIVDQARRVAKRSRRKKIIGDDVIAVLEDRNERPLMVEDYKPKNVFETDKETIFYEESSMIKVPKNGSEIQLSEYEENLIGLEVIPLVHNGTTINKYLKRAKKKSNPDFQISAPFDVYLNSLARALTNDEDDLPHYCHHIETSPVISQIVPYFGWMVENLFGFEGSHDGNILLVIDSLLRNPYVNVIPIVGKLSSYITERLHQNIDLGMVSKYQFEKTIQERAANVLNCLLSIQNINHETTISNLKSLKNKNSVQLGTLIAIPRSAEMPILTPTDHPMSLVNYILKTKRLDTLSYLEKEHSHLSSPFISLATTKSELSTPTSLAAPPTDTLSPQKFRKCIRFKLKINNFDQKHQKIDMDYSSQLKSKTKLTIKYGKARPINDKKSAGSNRGKSKRSYGSSAPNFQIFFGIKKVKNIKTNFIEPTALNMKDIKYI
jgi:hypothetical protein